MTGCRSATACKQRVSDGMAERVVDSLEVVEIEAEHGNSLAARRADERTFHLLAKAHPIRQVA